MFLSIPVAWAFSSPPELKVSMEQGTRQGRWSRGCYVAQLKLIGLDLHVRTLLCWFCTDVYIWFFGLVYHVPMNDPETRRVVFKSLDRCGEDVGTTNPVNQRSHSRVYKFV